MSDTERSQWDQDKRIDAEVPDDDGLNIEEGNVSGQMDTDSALRDIWSSQKRKKERRSTNVERKPRPKLTDLELTGYKGLGSLMYMFANFEPHDKLGPYGNMNALLGKMENWAHNLYPSLNFDDFLAKMEPLGRKKRVKIAMGMLRSGGTLLDLDDVMQREHKGDAIINDELNDYWEETVTEPSTIPSREVSATMKDKSNRQGDASLQGGSVDDYWKDTDSEDGDANGMIQDGSDKDDSF